MAKTLVGDNSLAIEEGEEKESGGNEKVSFFDCSVMSSIESSSEKVQMRRQAARA